MLEDCLSLFFGYRCHICDRTLARGILCSRCSPRPVDTISWPRCSCCFSILKSPWDKPKAHCEICEAYPPPFRTCHYLFEYTEGLRHTLRYTKYHPSYLMAKELVRHALNRDNATITAADYDILTVIPPSIRGSWKRDFHLPSLFTYSLARTFPAHRKPKLMYTLSHHWYFTPQATLRTKQRIKNMKDSWRVVKNVRGLKILLIDDVLTTGSTILSATQALRSAGASSIDVLALTRSPNFDRTQAMLQRIFWSQSQ